MSSERWLVTGASGQLGGHVVRRLVQEGAAGTVLALAGRGDVGTPGVEVHHIDLRDEQALRVSVRTYRPTHVAHFGAMTSVADAYARPGDAEQINTHATQALAQAAADVGAWLVFSSTDMVFDGNAAPYRESDAPNPLSHYGRTKLAAERLLLGREHALVIRLPLMYGLPVGRRTTTFVSQIAALRSGQALRLFTDEFRTPLWLADAARAAIVLARSKRTGVIHLAGPRRLSRYALVATCASLLGIADAYLEPVSRLSIPAAEPRPADLSLDDSLLRRLYPELVARPVSTEALVEPGTTRG